MKSLDLVIKIVRGQSPIPEFQDLEHNYDSLARSKLKKLRNDSSNSGFLSKLAMILGPRMLAKTWNRMTPTALTMCGDKTIEHLLEAMKTIHREGIPGDFIEAGVWRGGLPIIMRAFLEEVGDRDRTVYLADSFQGLPTDPSDPKDQDAVSLMEPLNQLAAEKEIAENAFKFFGLLDEQVRFVPGWFHESLPGLDVEAFALVRLDGDYYESTRDSLVHLYHRLSPGGYLIVDDYNLPLGCKRAVDEFRNAHGIAEPIIKINRQAVYWRKEQQS